MTTVKKESLTYRYCIDSDDNTKNPTQEAVACQRRSNKRLSHKLTTEVWLIHWGMTITTTTWPTDIINISQISISLAQVLACLRALDGENAIAINQPTMIQIKEAVSEQVITWPPYLFWPTTRCHRVFLRIRWPTWYIRTTNFHLHL